MVTKSGEPTKVTFDHDAYIQTRLTAGDVYNDAETYGINIEAVAPTAPFWRIIGIRHLTGTENNGNHNVYLEMIDRHGNKIRGGNIAWTWEGRHQNEPANPVVLDKPDREPGGNITMHAGQKVTVGVKDVLTDKAGLFHTSHADEEPGNTWGHHSFYVLWQLTDPGITEPDPNPVPTPDPPTKTYEAELREVKDKLTGVIGFIDGVFDDHNV